MELYRFDHRVKLKLPFFISYIKAGFPSPADDYIEKGLDLNELLVRHEAATYFVRASGDSMMGAGIHDGDILIVDRSLEPQKGDIVIAAVNGELTVKRFDRSGDAVYLHSANERYKPIRVLPEMEFAVWGVVTYVIHRAS